MAQPGTGEGRSPGTAEIGAIKPKVPEVKAPPDITPAQEKQVQVIEAAKKDGDGAVNNPDEVLERLAEDDTLPDGTTHAQPVKESQQENGVLSSEQRLPGELDGAKLAAGEKEYISATLGKNKDLADFYTDARTDAAYVQKQVDDFAGERGIHHETVDSIT